MEFEGRVCAFVFCSWPAKLAVTDGPSSGSMLSGLT